MIKGHRKFADGCPGKLAINQRGL